MACTAQARHCWEYDGQLWRETGRTNVEHNMGAIIDYESNLLIIGECQVIILSKLLVSLFFSAQTPYISRN